MGGPYSTATTNYSHAAIAPSFSSSGIVDRANYTIEYPFATNVVAGMGINTYQTYPHLSRLSHSSKNHGGEGVIRTLGTLPFNSGARNC